MTEQARPYRMSESEDFVLLGPCDFKVYLGEQEPAKVSWQHDMDKVVAELNRLHAEIERREANGSTGRDE